MQSVDIMNEICLAVKAAGSNQSALAKEIGISAQYLSDVLRGNRNPGKKILDFLGIEKVVIYRRKHPRLSALTPVATDACSYPGCDDSVVGDIGLCRNHTF